MVEERGRLRFDSDRVVLVGSTGGEFVESSLAETAKVDDAHDDDEPNGRCAWLVFVTMWRGEGHMRINIIDSMNLLCFRFSSVLSVCVSSC